MTLLDPEVTCTHLLQQPGDDLGLAELGPGGMRPGDQLLRTPSKPIVVLDWSGFDRDLVRHYLSQFQNQPKELISLSLPNDFPLLWPICSVDIRTVLFIADRFFSGGGSRDILPLATVRSPKLVAEVRRQNASDEPKPIFGTEISFA